MELVIGMATLVCIFQLTIQDHRCSTFTVQSTAWAFFNLSHCYLSCYLECCIHEQKIKLYHLVWLICIYHKRTEYYFTDDHYTEQLHLQICSKSCKCRWQIFAHATSMISWSRRITTITPRLQFHTYYNKPLYSLSFLY